MIDLQTALLGFVLCPEHTHRAVRLILVISLKLKQG